MSIITDSKKINDLLTRSVENIYPSRDFLESRLQSGQRLTIYLGVDPTGPTLHLGHAITLMKLKQFQELGHRVILLIGSFTAMIGDPTDKSSTRQPLTREQVLENCQKYEAQAKTFLNFSGDNPAEMRFNSEWLDKLTFKEVVELASHFTVQQMLERDMFEKRLSEGKPIGLHEFLYPLMQGYDSVAMDVDGEIGGNDQTFNMLAGRALVKDYNNKEKFVLTLKLLADTTGKKMGKSEGNMLTLEDSATDMFGKVMSWTDGMILGAFELCTFVSNDEIKQLKERFESGENPRNLKVELARAIVSVYYGAAAGEAAEADFVQKFQKKEIPDDIVELKPTSNNIIDVLLEAGFATSKGDARRALEQNGVKVNQAVLTDLAYSVAPGDIVQKGKRFFVKII